MASSSQHLKIMILTDTPANLSQNSWRFLRYHIFSLTQTENFEKYKISSFNYKSSSINATVLKFGTPRFFSMRNPNILPEMSRNYKFLCFFVIFTLKT